MSGKRGPDGESVADSSRASPPPQSTLNEVILNDHEIAVAVDATGTNIVFECGKRPVRRALLQPGH